MGTPRTAIVTGATSGLGAHITTRLLEQGYVVYAWGRSWNDDDLYNHPHYANERFIPEYVDLTELYYIHEAFEKWDYKEIDLLVNNAGVFSERPFYQEDTLRIRSIVDTNLTAAMYVTLKALRTCPVHRIINIASVSGLDGIANQAIYSASKAGLIAFGNSLSQELRNTTVTSIIPGGIKTELWNKYKGRAVADFMEPEDVWKAIEFVLQSDPKLTVKEIVMFPKEDYHP